MGHVLASATLAVGAIVGWTSLVSARERGDFAAVAWFGYLVLGLAFGSLLCVAIPLVLQIQAQGDGSAHEVRELSSFNDDYLAKYSFQDKIIAVTLVVFWGFLTLSLLLRSRLTAEILAPLILGVGALWYAIHVTTTSILFTKEYIIAQLPGFRTVSEPYDAIRKVQAKPGTVRIQFLDGRSLKLHPGLGDPDLVIGYLQARCPKHVYPENWPRRR
jgi:hypothetical protein